MPTLDIKNFINSFNKELARPSRFDVYFNIPSPLLLKDTRDPVYLNSLDLSLRCESAQLPSRTLMTTEQKIYGITEKYPYENSYNDAEFVFLVSGDMREKKFFDKWINLVSPKLTYNMNYKEDYATSVIVNQYNVANKLQYSVELRKAFPISVNQLDLDWSSDGSHKLAVVFAFSDWITGSRQNET
jgi:hypothetical protein